MRRRRLPSDEELIRYLEGEVTQSRAGQIVILAESNAAQRKRIEALEQTMDLLARPDPRVEEIDLVAGIMARIEAGDPPRRNHPLRALLAVGALIAAVVIAKAPMLRDSVQEPRTEHQQNVERAILSVLSLEATHR